jgi:hypothetical protein
VDKGMKQKLKFWHSVDLMTFTIVQRFFPNIVLNATAAL